MAQIASVAAITGTGAAFAVNEQGVSRQIKAGDVLQKGETIRTVGNAHVELLMEDGRLLAIAPEQSVRLDENVVESDLRPTAQDSAVTTPGATAETVIQALERGGDLSAELEATAAGLTGGAGADGGVSFVQLLRITEGVTPLAYNYGFAAPDLPPDVQATAVPLEEPAISIGVTVGTGIGVGGEGGGSGFITGDIIQGTVSSVDVVEGSGGGTRPVTFLITLDKVSSTDVTVTYTIYPGSADRPEDFRDGPISGTITIPAGYIGFSMTQYIVEDTLVEGNETFTIVLSNPIGATLVNDTATVTIIDDDAATVSLSVSPADITEAGSEVTYTATLTGATFSTDVAVTLSNGQVITIAAGQTSGSVGFTFAPSDDVYVDPSSVNVVITGANAGAFTDKLTIDGAPATVNIADTVDTTTVTLGDVTVSEGSGTATISASVNHAPQGSNLVLTLSNGATITILAGQTTGTSSAFAVQGDDVYNDGENYTVGITGSTGGNYEALDTSDTALVTITDTVDTTTVTLGDVTVSEGGTYTIEATITSAPLNGPLVLTLSNGATVTFAVGGPLTVTSTAVTAPNVPNGGGSSTVTINSGYTGGTEFENLVLTGTGTVTIHDRTPTNPVNDIITVEEESIPGIGGNDELDGYSYTTTGTFADNATWGSDGFGGIVSVNGVSLVVSGFITASDTAGTLVVNAATGTYTYTLNSNLLQAGVGENTQTAPSFAIVAKDGDGSTISFSLNVNVIDDVPTLAINDLSVDRFAATYSGTGLFLAGADGAPVQPYTLTWDGKPSQYAFTQTAGTSEWKATFVDANDVTQTFFTVTLKPDGSYDFQLNTALPTVEKSSGSLFSGITGGSNLASYTFTADKFGGAFSLVLTASDNKTGADTLTISKDELGINGNSIQENSKETLKIDVVQQVGFETASLTSLTIGLASTGSLKTGDTFAITTYFTGGASSIIPATYDGSGFLTVQFSTSSVIDYLTLTPTTNNMNFKITGMSVEYTQPIDPSDMNLQFTATGVDNDGDTVSDGFTVNLIAGTSGNDTLLTGSANDTVSGGAGNDTINTGAGNDILIGGAGNDTLTGGLGSDTFKWSLGDQGTTGSPARDVVKDFTVAQGDSLDLRDLLQGEHSTADGTYNLTKYLQFGVESGKLVLSVDHDGGATFAATQKIVLDNFTTKDALAGVLGLSAGSDDATILNKMITDGHLKTDI
jgi:hypothetical protein